MITGIHDAPFERTRSGSPPHDFTSSSNNNEDGSKASSKNSCGITHHKGSGQGNNLMLPGSVLDDSDSAILNDLDLVASTSMQHEEQSLTVTVEQLRRELSALRSHIHTDMEELLAKRRANKTSWVAPLPGGAPQSIFDVGTNPQLKEEAETPCSVQSPWSDMSIDDTNRNDEIGSYARQALSDAEGSIDLSSSNRDVTVASSWKRRTSQNSQTKRAARFAPGLEDEAQVSIVPITPRGPPPSPSPFEVRKRTSTLMPSVESPRMSQRPKGGLPSASAWAKRSSQLAGKSTRRRASMIGNPKVSLLDRAKSAMTNATTARSTITTSPRGSLNLREAPEECDILSIGETSQSGSCDLLDAPMKNGILHNTSNNSMTRASDFAYLKSVASRKTADPASYRQPAPDPLFMRIVSAPLFDGISAMLIVINSITIGSQADYEARHSTSEVPDLYLVSEKFFAGVFTLELLARFAAFRMRFFEKTGVAWGIFDMLVVGMQVIEELLLWIWGADSNSSNVSFVRLVRLLRLVRILRVLRIIRFMDELRGLVVSILNSMRSLFWTLVLLLLGIYAIGVYFTQLVADYRIARVSSGEEDDPELIKYFGGLSSSMLSLYQAMSGGVDWEALANPLVASISPLQGFVLSLYVAFAVLALTNVVTGVFVEGALKSAREDEEAIMIEQLHDAFARTDADCSGRLSTRQFQEHLNSDDMKEYLAGMNVNIEEAMSLFDLLDADGSGSIDYNEFVGGCMRLRGSAKAIDMIMLLHETRVFSRKMEEAMGTVAALVSQLMQGPAPSQVAPMPGES